MRHCPKLRATCIGIMFVTLAIASSAQAQYLLRRHSLRRRQPIVLYASHPDFEQTNVVSGEIGEGTGGVTEGLKHRVVLPLTGALAETDHVLGHELVHAHQYDLARRRDDQDAGGSSLDRLPLWFVEGMAEYLSLGPVDPHPAMWLRDAARDEKLPDGNPVASDAVCRVRRGSRQVSSCA